MSKYDIIIIGSGLGGLECGAILSKEGYHVCVLEIQRMRSRKKCAIRRMLPDLPTKRASVRYGYSLCRKPG